MVATAIAVATRGYTMCEIALIVLAALLLLSAVTIWCVLIVSARYNLD